MKKVVMTIGVMAALLPAISGCQVSSRLTAANLTQPVMVGPVCRIGGDRCKPGAADTAKNTFDIWVINGNTNMAIVGPGEAGGGKLAEAADKPEKADGELLRRVSSADDRITIDEIGFRSYTFGMFLIIVNATHYRSGVGIAGAVYGK